MGPIAPEEGIPSIIFIVDASAPSASVARGFEEPGPSFLRFAALVAAACLAANAAGSSRRSSYSVRILFVTRDLRLWRLCQGVYRGSMR